MNNVDNIAILHKGEDIEGGAERVAWEIQRTVNAPLYVGFRNENVEPSDITDVTELFSGPLSQFSIKKGGPLRELAYLYNWMTSFSPIKDIRKYDIVIGSGLETLLYCGPDSQSQIQYVHHTGRRYTDLLYKWPDNFRGRAGRMYSVLLRLLTNEAVNRPDIFVCNSEIIAHRVKKYWNIDRDKIRVVYPPVPTHEFSRHTESTGEFYLTISRLEPHKRIGEIIDVFNQLPNKSLKIAGDGPEDHSLQAKSSSNIDFLGFVSESEKQSLLAKAKGFVYNAENEDFGIAPVEALASGTPVLGVKEGMTQFQIVDGKNGYRFEREGKPSLFDAVQNFEKKGIKWSESEIEQFAERFSVDEFRSGIRAVISEVQDKPNIRPDWYPTKKDIDGGD
ncbi:glycosyltransferase [Halorubrum halophilum]|uniref:glycosyltransferase n=1 Tax=Halorubrum halophilum TaxID=413816 RepID=UPI0009E1D8AC|nr:glycosyltransferase [Halorubrum halophilum]